MTAATESSHRDNVSGVRTRFEGRRAAESSGTILRRVCRDLRHDPSWRFALVVIAASRALVLVLASFQRIELVLKPGQATCGGVVGACSRGVYVLWRWDAAHYIAMASRGYGPRHSDAAFFPLFPTVVGLLARPFGGTQQQCYWTGLVVANVAFLLGLVLVYRLARAEFSTAVARAAVLLLAFSPIGVYFVAPYAEPLSVPLAVAALLFAKRDAWLRAGLFGMLTTLTKPDGVALTVPLLVIALRRFGPRDLLGAAERGARLRALAGVVLVPAGLLVYMLYLQIAIHEPLEFLRVQHQVWNRTTAFPWVTLFHGVTAIGHHRRVFLGPEVFDALFTVLPLALLLSAARRVPVEYTLYGVTVALISLVSPYKAVEPLASVPRHLLACVAFPLAMAVIAERRRDVGLVIVVTSVSFFAFTAVLFVADQWVA